MKLCDIYIGQFVRVKDTIGIVDSIEPSTIRIYYKYDNRGNKQCIEAHPSELEPVELWNLA